MELAICVRNLPASELIAAGRFAEDHGYAEVFVPDSARGGGVDERGRLGGRDAFTTLAAMFTRTTSVKATVGVAAVPMHHRLVLPNLAASLQEMSDGRFSLGLGVSHPEQTARMGVDFPPRQIGKHLSEVLTLGVPDDAGNVVLIGPDRDVPLGGRLY